MADVVITCGNYAGEQQISFNYEDIIDYRFTYNLPTESTNRLSEDFLIVAAVINIADRAIRRRMRLGEFVRSFKIQLCVNYPERWTAASQHLIEAISFLTTDNWQFTFKQRRPVDADVLWRLTTRKRTYQDADEDTPAPNAVALFSGGLDSYCGASYMFDSPDQNIPLFITTYQKDILRLNDGLLKPLAARSGAHYRYFPVFYQVSSQKISGMTTKDFSEYSRRSRSFLYLAQAVSIAMEFRIDDVYIFENGILSLNLPVRRDRTGARTTRHAHPFFIAKFEILINELLAGGSKISIHNPFQNYTKAEILRFGGSSVELINNTISCWDSGNFTATLRNRLGRREITHCGFCLPCLIRRLALRYAKIPEDGKIYAYDVFEAAIHHFPSPAERPTQWQEARAILRFADDIHSSDLWSFFWNNSEKLFHLQPEVDTLEPVFGMFKRFADEVVSTIGD